nr:collagen alpha-1(I) chain isoform X2 [Oryctolagus cuniculus]XP_051692987.1 collagen alpha-1(I) chain isoform X2 [Oryctolagus cuniculus]XP_051692988.1 collagen alpha-1(I) chain isoform X2 [Oryctolagus cuniculus]XP_051692990.1 collagen alpha-1(I) chain isoform X2 [Oryctolagus cuniculus]XP_051692991.1 collagen alpha-1(I) chain isoform X2 [Oryctolagus cuniculus]XP_051692992.1 collagen alpha-1(I) chain isoform X2 [Oryctolagus cuniculus]XP_051692993.1 collagen alpha-1(I) chain isoform X2 [Orycto
MGLLGSNLHRGSLASSIVHCRGGQASCPLPHARAGGGPPKGPVGAAQTIPGCFKEGRLGTYGDVHLPGLWKTGGPRPAVRDPGAGRATFPDPRSRVGGFSGTSLCLGVAPSPPPEAARSSWCQGQRDSAWPNGSPTRWASRTGPGPPAFPQGSRGGPVAPASECARACAERPWTRRRRPGRELGSWPGLLWGGGWGGVARWRCPGPRLLRLDGQLLLLTVAVLGSWGEGGVVPAQTDIRAPLPRSEMVPSRSSRPWSRAAHARERCSSPAMDLPAPAALRLCCPGVSSGEKGALAPPPPWKGSQGWRCGRRGLGAAMGLGGAGADASRAPSAQTGAP